MSLYRKYRPTDLTQVKGNAEVVETLTGMFKDLSTFPHSLLLHGPTGCGKTTIARIIAESLECKGNDYQEINSANFRGIDTVRDLIRQSAYMPMESAVRVWVLDEIHKMTGDAQNALLKILEDTPPHVYFILCTTEPQKLLPTIRGRCSQFQVNLLSEAQMRSLLRRVVKEEEETLESEILDQIIQDSLGHPRNALQVLEQVLTVPLENRLEIAKQVAEQQSQIVELCRALLKGESWRQVLQIINGVKTQEAEDIRRSVLGYMQAVLLKGDNDRAAYIMEQFWEPTYNVGFPYITYTCYCITKNK